MRSLQYCVHNLQYGATVLRGTFATGDINASSNESQSIASIAQILTPVAPCTNTSQILLCSTLHGSYALHATSTPLAGYHVGAVYDTLYDAV